ncbi:MAG: hypothetical protein AB8G15_12170 [Saprospiraceae bacterium]
MKMNCYLLLALCMFPFLSYGQKKVDFRIPFERAAADQINDLSLAAYRTIKRVDSRSYSTDTLGNILKDDPYLFFTLVDFPNLRSYRVKKATQDTTTRIEYELYHKDTLALRSVKGFQLGQTSFLFYAKNGAATRKENYFNGKLSSIFEYQYDAAGNLIRINRDFSEFEKSKEYSLFFYDKKNVLIGRKDYVKGELLNDLTYDNVKKERSAAFKEMKRKSNAKYNLHAQFMKDNTFFEYDKQGNWTKKTFKDKDGRHHITERKIEYL